MKSLRTLFQAIAMMALTCCITSTLAQEVIIPDPGLNAAIRETLNKPAGPLTQQDMLGLTFLNAHDRNISNLEGLETALNLNALFLISSHLTNFSLPGELTKLAELNLFGNALTNVALPGGMTNLSTLVLRDNPLLQFTLPAGLTRLEALDLGNDRLTSLTLPPDMTNLFLCFLDNNPLTMLVLPQPLATGNLAATVTDLQNQGVPVFTYPLAIRLSPLPPQPVGAFRFAIIGPPGDYTVLTSTNLVDWSELGLSRIPLGSNVITDFAAQFSPQKFYRARAQP